MTPTAKHTYHHHPAAATLIKNIQIRERMKIKIKSPSDLSVASAMDSNEMNRIFHDLNNLYLADGSRFNNFEEKNPTLTVMAFGCTLRRLYLRTIEAQLANKRFCVGGERR